MEKISKDISKNSINHRIKFDNRSEGMLTGIVDVLSFDAEEIVFESQCGGIILKGNNLHIKNLNLDNGEVSVDGSVDSLIYTKSKAKDREPLLKKIFK